MSHPTAEVEQMLAERPPAPVRTETFRASRPSIVGPDSPAQPFPIYLSGAVQRGFGRGGKDLGCPTGELAGSMNHISIDVFTPYYLVANLPDDSITPMSSVCETGVYYGYAQVSPSKDEQTVLHEDDTKVQPMVMSLGWNPFYKNERLTAVSSLHSVILLPRHTGSYPMLPQEIHIMHEFKSDFYGHNMRAIVLGYIRPELDYTSRGECSSSTSWPNLTQTLRLRYRGSH